MTEKQEEGQGEGPKLVDKRGPWIFTTRRVYEFPDARRQEWSSRFARKRISPQRNKGIPFHTRFLHSLWEPGKLNWWIGIIFAIGSAFFAAGSVFFLWPSGAKALDLSDFEINLLYFIGSIPFTTAAYLQLFQAANMIDDGSGVTTPPARIYYFGWVPKDIGWLACALQFIGTVLFNFNTFDALIPHLDWLQQDLAIWVPDFIGSVLFLASGYLIFAEECDGWFAWKTEEISWWVTFINLLGCIAFMISAVFAFVPQHGWPFNAAGISVFWTLIGAISFFVGSVLMLPEAHEELTADTSK